MTQFLRERLTKIKVRLNSLSNVRKASGTLVSFLGQRNCFCGGHGNSIQSDLLNYPCNSFSIQIHFHTDCSPIFTNTNVFSQLVLIKQICFYKLLRNLLFKQKDCSIFSCFQHSEIFLHYIKMFLLTSSIPGFPSHCEKHSSLP